MTNRPPKTPRTRPFSLWQLLALNRPTLWQLTLGASCLMLGLSLILTGAPLGGMAVGLAGLSGLSWGGYNTLYLIQHDLPLLRTGTLVAARVTGEVKHSSHNLYRIIYRLPGEQAERYGVFLAANDSLLNSGEPVAIMINPRNPSQLVEISGRYERLFGKKPQAA